MTDDDTRTWIGKPPEPDDIRTWDGLQAIIEANENWGAGHIIEQMKAAGWQSPVEHYRVIPEDAITRETRTRSFKGWCQHEFQVTHNDVDPCP